MERLLILKIKMIMNVVTNLLRLYGKKGIEYQLLYRNVEENDEKVIKQNLLYIANKMK